MSSLQCNPQLHSISCTDFTLHLAWSVVAGIDLRLLLRTIRDGKGLQMLGLRWNSLRTRGALLTQKFFRFKKFWDSPTKSLSHLWHLLDPINLGNLENLLFFYCSKGVFQSEKCVTPNYAQGSQLSSGSFAVLLDLWRFFSGKFFIEESSEKSARKESLSKRSQYDLPEWDSWTARGQSGLKKLLGHFLFKSFVCEIAFPNYLVV